MAIVTFYNCDPKDAPKTTMPAHLGANAVITCRGRLLLEKRRDSDIWGLIGGGCKKSETASDHRPGDLRGAGAANSQGTVPEAGGLRQSGQGRRLPGRKHLADGDRGLRSGAAGGAGNADQRGIERTAIFHPGGNRENRDRRDPPGYYPGLV